MSFVNKETVRVQVAAFRGAQGPAGPAGPTGLQGDTGPQGPTGPAGYTPVRGTDYWTAADKAEIVSDVLAALPNASGVSF